MSDAVVAEAEYISAGGNRHSAASAWHVASGCLAYGTDHNVALWHPLSKTHCGVHRLLKGHSDKVTALTFADSPSSLLISGSADGEVIIRPHTEASDALKVSHRRKAHDGAVNIICSLAESQFIVTGGADACIKVWRVLESQLELVHTIKPKPRFIPLALTAGAFPATSPEDGFFVVAAGTRNDIQVFSLESPLQTPSTTCSRTLSGHEGWIRGLALTKSPSGFLLASTSADKYVRLWKFQTDQPEALINGVAEKTQVLEQSLTAKVKTVSLGGQRIAITFEALLLGHEDWVYSADWQDTADPKILTASADGTLAIWESDPTSGIWISETRLGEISGQKGATTATGSSGGFWTGKWISNAENLAVVSLGRTGSWRVWQYDPDTSFWNLKFGIGGHVSSVNSLAWSPRGEYLLTTSSDQTTRLHAAWRRGDLQSWHEFSRCQIHGYDCNVVTCVNATQFVSGADEKLLRVFNQPKELADVLHRLCGIEISQDTVLPDTAAIPVLGLSNKELGEPDDIVEAGPRRGQDDYAAANALAGISLHGIVEPPNEDLLARHTLWPEHEKLYGHGYEVSEAAYKDGILATACKASSIDHATIRLYSRDNDWRQVEPPLKAHSLTITRLAWSEGAGPRFLLSVGRDRQWSVFSQSVGEHGRNRLELVQAMPKAHTRMILDAAWSPTETRDFFATAGRDKVVKIWGKVSQNPEPEQQQPETEERPSFRLCGSLARPSAVTAVSMSCTFKSFAVLAVGEEDGTLSIHMLDQATLQVTASTEIDRELCSTKAVTRLAWSPTVTGRSNNAYLAVAGADGSVQIIRIDLGTITAS